MMEAFSTALSARIKNAELSMQKTDELIKQLGENLEKYVDRAKETLKKKHVINPKPQKRFMRIISESDESTSEKQEESVPVPVSKNNVEPLEEIVQQKSPQRESLRPVRTAKVNANKNLKEVPTNAKIRNDNNVAVYVKTERVSTANKKVSRGSTKENTQPNNQNERLSVDEGIQMGSETDLRIPEKNGFKRSQSVEIVPTKPVEIDITDERDIEKMPPPPIPVKNNKKKAQKQSSQETPVDPAQPIPVRFTRSKIKKEKPSIGRTVSSKELPTTSKSTEEEMPIQKSASESILENQSKIINESTMSKKAGNKKKYPMPILIKMERVSSEETASNNIVEPAHADEISNTDTENIPPLEQQPKTSQHKQSDSEKDQNFPINETVTINTNLPVNQTVTLANNVNETYNKNMHDSLMTEDNDEDVSMEVPLVQLKEKNTNKVAPPQLPLKFKKNEVFNPYLSSPVKQKVQAFEKHVVNTATTPDKSKPSTSKFNTLKAGTPSKIALYSKTTPLNNAKQKYIAAITGSASSSAPSTSSSKKLTKKITSSMSHESNEDLRKNQALSINQQLEKKKQRDEKQKQVQLQREAIEKQKREQTLQQQREREEKFRRIMQEKEEAKKMEALKKKMLKENQEKKYAEEKARKEEIPKEPQSASKDDSLYIKMQKQIIAEKTLSQKKKVDKNAYSFEMLNTDDSTDDESHPSKKRPEPPQWSKKQIRKKQIFVQSFANSSLLDTLFSSHPINVNLKEVFPSIDARKLIRNSSAVWNTPPRYSQIPKY